jgi:hypothetical protein
VKGPPLRKGATARLLASALRAEDGPSNEPSEEASKNSTEARRERRRLSPEFMGGASHLSGLATRAFMDAASAGKVSWDATTTRPLPMDGPMGGEKARASMREGLSGGGSSARPAAWEATCNVPALVVSEPRLWSPDEPFLYDLKVTLKQDLVDPASALTRRQPGAVHGSATVLGSATGQSRGTFGRLADSTPPSDGADEDRDGLSVESVTIDEVWSYGAMREVGRARGPDGHLRMTLNGSPLFHLGTLDQGWWPDGLLTPPSDAAQASAAATEKNHVLFSAASHRFLCLSSPPPLVRCTTLSSSRRRGTT